MLGEVGEILSDRGPFSNMNTVHNVQEKERAFNPSCLMSASMGLKLGYTFLWFSVYVVTNSSLETHAGQFDAVLMKNLSGIFFNISHWDQNTIRSSSLCSSFSSLNVRLSFYLINPTEGHIYCCHLREEVWRDGLLQSFLAPDLPSNIRNICAQLAA